MGCAHPTWRFLAAILFCVATRAGAQSLPTTEDPARRLLDEQRAQQRQREIDQAPAQIAAPAPATSAVPDLPPGADVETLPDAEPTFVISQIAFTGATVLNAKQLDAVTQPFVGKRLGRNRINLLLRRLTEAYVAHGYITTRVYLGKQNLDSGTLTVTVIPGRIEGIALNGAALRPAPADKHWYQGIFKTQGGGLVTDAGTAWAFPTAVGDVLRLPDLEQGVDQLNRLRRNQAELQILPGQAPGDSIVSIKNPYGNRFGFDVGIDNYGSSQTGTMRYRVGGEADNLIGLQEATALSYIGTQDSNALVFSEAVPVGYQTFSYTASVSEYQELIGASSSAALLFGRTFSQIVGWNGVLTRSQSGRLSLDATLTKLSSQRNVNGADLDPQNLTVMRLALSDLHRFVAHDEAAALTGEVGVSQGLPWLAATHDAAGIDETDAHAQFTRLDWNGTLQLPLGRLGPTAWTYRGALDGQYSRVALFGNEQLYLGGMDTVRGFVQGNVSGDSRFYWRNECVWSNAPALGDAHWEPYAFLDGGKAHLVAQGGWPTLMGAGLGVRGQWQFRNRQSVSAEVLVGQALLQPAALGHKATVVLATVNWSG